MVAQDNRSIMHPVHIVQGVSNAHCAYRSKAQRFNCINDGVATDPCMGSGHILVYLFDVLMQIYEANGYGPREAAESILRNNLYGLDIDERAAQMAYFAVMMKARQYNRRILTLGIEPHVFEIEESNGFNRNHLEYFGADLSEIEKNNALTQVNGLLDQLHDAKEYGSMLTIDNYDWDLLSRFAETTSVIGQLSMETVGIDDTQDQLKQLIAIGKALAQKYNVTVTNPPYMAVSNGSIKMQGFVKKHYPNSKADLFTVFIERCTGFTSLHGYQAMITQHGWMFLASFEKFRLQFLSKDIINMAHLGARAFDEIGGEVVQTTSFIARNSNILNYNAAYCRLLEGTSEESKEALFFDDKLRFCAKESNFNRIIGSPYAYWVSENMLDDFSNGVKLGDLAFPCQGMATTNNDLFLKLWSEVNYCDIKFDAKSEEDTYESKYYPYNKGGEYRKWFGNNSYVIYFKNKGKDVCDYIDSHSSVNHKGRVINRDKYFKENFTWGALASSLSCRFSPEGFIFDTKGSSCFSYDKSKLMYYLGLMNSNVSAAILDILAPTLDFNCGTIAKMPVIFNEEKYTTISDATLGCCDISKNDWDSFENSWDFKEHPFIRLNKELWDATAVGASMHYYYGENAPAVGSPLELCYMLWQGECNERFKKLKENEEELNRIFIDIYGLQDELTPEVEDKDVTVRKADLGRDIRSFISYAVGCMFGRYSLDTEGLAYAGGDWDDSKYKTFIPDADNVLPITDEEYLEDDIVGLFCAWLKKVFGEDSLEANLDFIANALGNKGNTNREVIRNYFLNDFFKDHCNTYSVTGSGKRPIYWLFDSGKQNGFKALVYLHRYTLDTIGNLRVDYLHKMQRIYESEMNRMQDTIDHSTNSREVAAATKRKEKLQKQLKECREYDEKIGHLALSRIELDLDDGVKKNYRKVQTASDGKFYEVLADSKNIMAKEK